MFSTAARAHVLAMPRRLSSANMLKQGAAAVSTTTNSEAASVPAKAEEKYSPFPVDFLANKMEWALARIDDVVDRALFGWASCAVELAHIDTPGCDTDPHGGLLSGILWAAVPKSRHTLERRMTRRFGSPHLGTSKLVRPNKKLRVDHATGEFFELGKVAPKTYAKVMEETKAIQKTLKEAFATSIWDKEVSIVYEDDEKKSEDNTRRLVEMPKKRPDFFSANLMQKVNRKDTDPSTTTVRPSQLG